MKRISSVFVACVVALLSGSPASAQKTAANAADNTKIEVPIDKDSIKGALLCDKGEPGETSISYKHANCVLQAGMIDKVSDETLVEKGLVDKARLPKLDRKTRRLLKKVAAINAALASLKEKLRATENKINALPPSKAQEGKDEVKRVLGALEKFDQKFNMAADECKAIGWDMSNVKKEETVKDLAPKNP